MKASVRTVLRSLRCLQRQHANWPHIHQFCISRRVLTTKAPILSPITLRPYQEQCIGACLDALAGGATRIGVSLPTGSGKTTVFISLLSRLTAPSRSPDATRAIIVVNSIELARQSAQQAKALFPHWTVEIEQGVKYKASGTADLTVATYQTLMQPMRLAKFDPARLKAIVVDEAHHAAAPSYRRLLSRFDPAIQGPEPDAEKPAVPHQIPILGFSATFSRHDGLALGSVFERIVYHRDFLEMIREQWLCNVRFTSVKANINLKDVTVNSRTGEFNPTSLAHVINTGTINELVVKSWLDRAVDRRSTLVFCVNLSHVRELTNTFRKYGIDARYLHAKTPALERNSLISAFKLGEFPVLVNCAILTEGTDIPNIDCVVVAKPTRSKNIFAQMIGRGMRQSPSTGKEDCHVIDFVDTATRLVGVVSTPTLFGLDPTEIVDGNTVEELQQRAEEAVVDADRAINSRPDSYDDIPDPTSVTYKEWDDPFSFAHGSSGSPHINTLSRNAWVYCGGDVHVLECLGKGHIRVEHVEDEEGGKKLFVAKFTPTLDFRTAISFKASPYGRNRGILKANTLAEAVKGCDTYAAQKICPGPMSQGLSRMARWRKLEASASQKSFIRKRWNKKISLEELAAGRGNDTESKIANLTKGEAANVITRVKHGALSRYENKQKDELKELKALTKEHRRQAREKVQEGPLPQAF